MKKILKCFQTFGVAGVLSFTPLSASAAVLAKVDVEYVRAMRDIDSICAVVWPGYSPFFPGMPVLVETHGPDLQIIFGHPSPPAGFLPLPEGVWKHKTGVVYFSTYSSFGLDSGWTIREVNSVKTQVYDFRSRDISPLESILLVHENFHAFQENEFAGVKHTGPKMKAPEMTSALMADAYIERIVLQKALLSGNREELVKDFVSLRNARYKRNNTLPAFEQYYERLEGVAKYVDANFAARLLSENGRDGLVQGLLSTQLMRSDLMDYKFHFYGTGAVQAMILDRMMPGWKERIKEVPSLFDLLKDAVKYDDEDEGARVRRLRARYNYQGFLKQSEKSLRNFNNIRDRYLRELDANKGYVLSIRMAFSELASERMAHRGTFRVTDTAYIYCNIEGTRLESARFRLDISHADYLKIDFPDKEDIVVDLPLGSSGLVKILADGKNIGGISGMRNVGSFVAVADGVRFEIKAPVVINVRGNKISIMAKK